MFKTIAKAIATSAAASIITNSAKTSPSIWKLPNLENATKLILAEFIINSKDIRTIIAFLRVAMPKIPNENKIALRTKKCVKPISILIPPNFLYGQ